MNAHRKPLSAVPAGTAVKTPDSERCRIRGQPQTLEALGLTPKQCAALRNLYTHAGSMIIIAGSTIASTSVMMEALCKDLRLSTASQNAGTEMRTGICVAGNLPYAPEGVRQLSVPSGDEAAFYTMLRHSHLFSGTVFITAVRNARDVRRIRAVTHRGALVLAAVCGEDAATVVARLQEAGMTRASVAALVRGIIVQEVQYDGTHPAVLADVAVAQSDLRHIIALQPTAAEIDAGFSHHTNVASRILHHLRTLPLPVWQRHTEPTVQCKTTEQEHA
ncbi:MAG: hypothetical protein IJ191_01335 [Treponema sp.]|nr:hypothetical protein [Treponema sp.]